VKAEAAYQVARAQHQMVRFEEAVCNFISLLTTSVFFQQQYDDAFRHYSEALQLNPDHILSQFGVGQLHLKRGL
jgi:RNA polymerase-associated protein CTR9